MANAQVESRGRAVPLARRNLFEDRRRAVLSLLGIGAGLLMVLLMTGLLVGMTKQETAYIDGSPADLFVSQRGVRTLQMSTTELPAGTLERVRAVPGVAWAESLRHTTTIVGSGEGRLISYLFGFDARGGHGGPRELSAGTMPGPGEVVLDAAGARQLHLGVGDTIAVFGTPLRVSGLVSGLTGLGNTTMFITSEQFAQMAGPGTNFVLVGADPSVTTDVVRERIATAVPEATVQTRQQFSSEQARTIEDLYTDVVRTMIAAGFLIALALVGLTLSTVTSSKLREYGVVKSLGATTGKLTSVVVSQAVWAIVAAMALATVLAVGMAFGISKVMPGMLLVIEPGSVLFTTLGAVIVGVPAAMIPLRRVLRVDPASAFRGGV
jgi:putative ABC transport system permease protein